MAIFIFLKIKIKIKKRWLNYLGHRLDDLKEHNITPIIVFDGQKVPVKQRCYSKRQQK
jgi:5'-3' exonuclease